MYDYWLRDSHTPMTLLRLGESPRESEKGADYLRFLTTYSQRPYATTTTVPSAIRATSSHMPTAPCSRGAGRNAGAL